ncbi:MAG: hypothetical protein C4336_02640 [Armatimonadota bacterium]
MRFTQRGSVFTEILIALTIVGMLVLSIAAVSPMTTRMQTQARQYTYATQIAQSVLERIRTMDFLQITGNGVLQAGLGEVVEVNNADYWRVRFTQIRTPGAVVVNLNDQLRKAQGTIEIFNLTTNNNISIGLKTVYVTIRWEEPRTGRQQQVQLATTIASLK